MFFLSLQMIPYKGVFHNRSYLSDTFTHGGSTLVILKKTEDITTIASYREYS